MARSSATITDDDEEIDLASFILDACGLSYYDDFMFEERILTREIFENSLEVLLKMAEHRSFRRSTYFVLGYFFLVTGTEMPEDLRYDILEAANWENEVGYWGDKEFEQERKIVVEDFCEKIRLLEPNRRLHPVTHLNYAVKPSQGVIGLRSLKSTVKSKTVKEIKAVSLQGWGLTSIPEEIFEMENLEYLSLDYNNISTLPTGLSKLKRLKYISLEYNNITALTDGTMNVLKKLPLVSLSLRNNDIALLPESLKEISVEMLYLSYNKLSVIPEFLKDIKGLKKLYLRGYELDKIPSSIKESKIILGVDFIYNPEE